MNPFDNTRAAHRIIDRRYRVSRRSESLLPVALSSLVTALAVLILALVLVTTGRSCQPQPAPGVPLTVSDRPSL